MLFAGAPWSRILEFIRDPLRVLDVFAIEIDHVKAAVRSGGREDRMEPRIGRSEKLLACFSAFGDERRARAHEPAALEEVVHRFADKEIATILCAECVAAIDGRTAGGSEVI